MTPLSHHEAGWHPIKVASGKKHPPEEGRTGYKGRNRTTAEVKVEDWSDCQLAVRTPPDVIGVDVDVYNGGDVTLAALEDKYGPLPPTVMTTARSDGSGIRFYRVPVGTHLTTAISPGIEIVQYFHRYAMVAPSINPRVDAEYRWIDQQSGEILDTVHEVSDLVDLPWAWSEGLAKTGGGKLSDRAATSEELVEFIDTYTTSNHPATLRSVERKLATVEVGGRHDTLVKASCWMLREARAGLYAAGDAMAVLEGWWTAVTDGEHREAEFVSALSWAVAEARATSGDRIEEVRLRQAESFDRWKAEQATKKRRAMAEWIAAQR